MGDLNFPREEIKDRALCEIHNRLGEIVVLLQVLVLNSDRDGISSEDTLRRLLDGAATMTVNNENLRSPTIEYHFNHPQR